MRALYVLNQKYLDVAAAEASALQKAALDESVITVTTRKIPDLALSHFAIELVATGARGNVRTLLSDVKPRGKYKVVLTKLAPGGESERELAAIVWRNAQGKVDLENPETIVDIVLTRKHAYVGIRKWTNKGGYEERRAHLRPEMHPSSMHPALARALVNISGARSIHDPCCGSGGILIEAALAGKKTSGADIDPAMVARAKRNCASYGLRPDIRMADGILWQPRVQAIITDLPYGKNTSPVAVQPFFEAILLRSNAKRAVIGSHSSLPVPKEWKLLVHLTVYVHKSMTKHFFVLERS